MARNPEEITLEEIQKRVEMLENWESEGSEKLHKSFTFDNFEQALAFTNKVGAVAEEQQHHPDIYLTWGKVKIEIQTHETGGLTQADFELAESIDRLN